MDLIVKRSRFRLQLCNLRLLCHLRDSFLISGGRRPRFLLRFLKILNWSGAVVVVIVKIVGNNLKTHQALAQAGFQLSPTFRWTNLWSKVSGIGLSNGMMATSNWHGFEGLSQTFFSVVFALVYILITSIFQNDGFVLLCSWSEVPSWVTLRKFLILPEPWYLQL